MYAEYLIIDNHAQSQKVKHVSEVMPNVGITVFSGAFCVKAIGLSDSPRLVVPPYEMNPMRVSKF